MTLAFLARSRFVIFALASTSFMCLLGEFYHRWSMRAFACSVLPLATLALIFLAIWKPAQQSGIATRIVQGTIGGLVAAVAYDLFRLPFVMHGVPLFGVFPRFGQMLLGAPATDFSPLVQVVGWIYHFSNAAALGIMFLALVPRDDRKTYIWGGALWALCVEILLLLTPYYSFFKLKLDWNVFLMLTLSAHLIFGLVLGAWCARNVRLPMEATSG